MDVERLNRLVSALGGWPDYFTDLQARHGKSLLAQLAEYKFVDQGVFAMVIRYGVHRAAFDELTIKIQQDETAPTETAQSNHFLTGQEQARAFHENRLAVLEKQLLATPYERLKAGVSAQTSFMAILDSPDPDPAPTDTRKKSEAAETRTVMPFRPIGRKKIGKSS